jgi:two-component system cell cycle sensor histidine kinase/response regulator CckA
MNILVVDDNETNRKLLRVTLQAEGHQTVEAGDGIEALEILKGQPVDAIISDILMPRMDGYRLCHEVRSIEQFRDIPFIIYTSTFTATPDEKLALEFGADRFIRKPAPLKEIIEALQPAHQKARHNYAKPAESAADLTALQGYSEVLVRKLEHRNSELQLTKEQLLRTNQQLVQRTEELEEARETLEITANQLQSLFDNLDDVFLSVDMVNQRVVQISPACEKVYGLPQEAFLKNAMLWKEVILPADRTLFEESEADLHAGKPLNHEYRIQRPDGRICWIQSKIKPSLDDTDRLVRIDGVLSDITERKHLEEQLLHSQKLEAVGRLAGGIAHDFNNLLTAIVGHSELVLDSLKSASPLRWEIDEIRKSAERAAALTRQLLAFSRKQLLEPKILDLNSAVANTERLLRRLIGEDVDLVTLMASDLRPVKADPGQIEQVIINLAVNARDAMPKGGKLTIETANVEIDEAYVQSHAMVRAGHYVMLAVSDNGCGMSQEVQSHIFEPFFTTKEPGKGTGLGLSTVYGIVKQSGGHIWVYSEPGSGTSLKIYLPQAEGEVELTAPASVAVEAARAGETILLAEDEDVVRRLILTVLRNKGYTVIEATDGEQALQMSTQHPGKIELLLTDTVMPGMSGPILSHQLKTARPEIKVLYMSGYTNDAVVLHEMLESSVAFLQKPFPPDALVRKVREVLDTR